MSRVGFDIETNGLMPEVDTLHCFVAKDIDTGERVSGGSNNPPSLKQAQEMCNDADLIFGHNVLSYDLPVLAHLGYPIKPEVEVLDTLILSKMIWPTDALKQLDFPRWRSGKLPGQLIGAQKLEAWGYRLGRMKGEYSADVKKWSKVYQKESIHAVPIEFHCLRDLDKKGMPILNPWKSWNQPMQDYCDQDVEVSEELFLLELSHLDGTAKAAKGVGWSKECVELEHYMWKRMEQLKEHGYGFNVEQAVKLISTLKTREGELGDTLVEAFGSWWEALDDKEKGKSAAVTHEEKLKQFKDVERPRISEKTGKPLKPYIGPPICQYWDDAPFVRIKRTTFNAKSRQHLGQRLQEVYGWVPIEWGGKEKDQAKVDEGTIKAISTDIIPADLKQTILEYLIIFKTLGQAANGKKAWIELVDDNKVLHCRIDPLGTVSHRGAHMNPNLGNVPAVSVEEHKNSLGEVIRKEFIKGWHGGFGFECRSLFGPTHQGWKQTGVDAQGLEFRLLAHELAPYDGGALADKLRDASFDIHAHNARLTGLSRGAAKTFIYAFLYGAGKELLGMQLGVDDGEIEELSTSQTAVGYVKWLKRTMLQQRKPLIMPNKQMLAWRTRGSEISKVFMDSITGLKEFQKVTQDEAKARGFVIAIDGRKLHVKGSHVAVNQKLQGGGAIVCKKWLRRTDELLINDYGLKQDDDFALMAWVHDENQYEHREEAFHAAIAEASERAIQEVAVELNFRGQLATEAKLGDNWKDCH